MRITFDPTKREVTLLDRQLDFNDAETVFAGKCIHIPDEGRDYGEERIITVGKLLGRMVIVVWTPRRCATRILDEESQCPRKSALWAATWRKLMPASSNPTNTTKSPN